MQPAPHRVVAIGPERRADVGALDQTAFMIPEEGLDRELAYFEWERTAGVVAGPENRLVGIHTAFSLGVSVPDGPDGMRTRRVPMAGLSWVGVDPAYRRRGVLRAMIRHHLHGLHEPGREASREAGAEAVSGLYASESAIYGRFGYGCAVVGLALDLPHGAALRPVPGAEHVAVDFVTADPD